MFRSIHINNFRAFKEVHLRTLGRVNLIVGRNNAGKTSALEAIQLLVSSGWLPVFRDQFTRRREVFLDRMTRWATVDRLFFGGGAGKSASFSINGVNEVERRTEGSLRLQQRKEDGTLTPPEEGWVFQFRISESNGQKATYTWEVEEGWAISLGRAGASARKRPSDTGPTENVRFLTTASLQRPAVLRMFTSVALTPDEQFITDALKVIEPNLTRLGVGSITPNTGVLFRMAPIPEDVIALIGDRRMPFGGLGEGMWRLLGLILTLIRCKDGYLLVDEIDTGLHYSALTRLWQIIDAQARLHNVQVFATTHSRDCVDALAAVCHADREVGEGVTIQRIERDNPEAIVYTEGEIIAAADRGLEVR